ncbi:NADH:ubiquinone oxidoreductase, 17.2kDa subunit [Artemisia annua]|uniref:NADH dehydrogenase [ubiquinone] 1 alpha subcomplex subunit 12 n=1 Tax=Artemisia annua TaxID=35608 RepID=A0A2U1QLZ2_ARTAN|nr:NADH:ubiquinone oxidoreductase, 17.2kDa subunit [Artemisia annua]
MASSVVKSVLNSIKERGLLNFARELRQEGFLNCLTDGNLLQTKIHNIGATLVGVDKFGNKYYQKLENTQYGRHRWVEYASKDRYNASQVPPEWHGWLHFVTDHTGDELLMLKPKRYGLDHKENSTGEGDEYIYHSKGHTLNPGQRDWTRYQSWQPTKTE